ncbi:hypothetical protein JDV02_002651 [Purpureocillium takamizusanense]|uniref:Chromo domain-containing protein n=1 Tax=Purpureocillium takamizusanense TaxID=2060973 RepID=A0A9Q8V7M8_9HYPO|nr:uncharacterized protein JDV02_002651 [Purpureocillium takamizusanense]UNI16190.1 hypothetical protein JDV02_002651 [Purpureocillium takamizusanense]
MATSEQLSLHQDLDDDISVASTLEETFDPDEDYGLLRILAERSFQEETLYLVEWEGCPLHDATWEPEENFQSVTLSEWEDIKKSTRRRTAVGFRVQEWKDAVLEAIRQKRERHNRRNRKRELLGLPQTDTNTSRQGELDYIESTMVEAIDPDDDQLPIEQSAADNDDSSGSDDGMTMLDKLRSSSQVERRQPRTKPTTLDIAPARSKNERVANVSASRGKPDSSSDKAKSAGGNQRKLETKFPLSPKRVLRSSAPAVKSNVAKSPGIRSKNTFDKHQELMPSWPIVTSGLPAVESTRATENRPKPSAQSPEEGLNVFAGGKVRRARKRLSEAVSDATKKPRLFSLRHQNLAQKQLRDNEGIRAPSLQLPLRSDTAPSTRRSSAPDVSLFNVNTDRDAEVHVGNTTRRTSLGPSLQTSDERSAGNSVAFSQDRRDIQKRSRAVRFDDEPQVKDFESLDEHESLFVEQDTPMLDVDTQVADPGPEQVEAKYVPSPGPPTLPSLPPIRKECRFGSEGAQPLGMNFVGVPSEETQASWAAHFRNNNELIFTHSCTSRDFLNPAYSRSEELCRGYAEGVPGSDPLDGITNDIRIGALGHLCYLGDYYVIVFSSRSEEWSPMQNRETPRGDSVLSFVLFKSQPLLNPDMLAPITYSTEKRPESSAFSPEERIPIIDLVFRTTLNLLSPPTSQHVQETSSSPSFFLAFPPSAEQEALFMSQLLKSSAATCDVKSSLKPGDWSAFVEQKQGTVVIHETAFEAIRSFPHLSDVLHASKSNFTFWLFRRPLLSTERFPQMVPALRAISAELRPILRPGTAILVTPSFLVSQPQQAYNFFKWGFQNFSQTSQTYYPGKLVLCAGIEDYILDLAMERAELYSKQQRNQHVARRELDARMKTQRLVQQLMSESSEVADSRVVFAPDTIDGNDEQSLVNWFGWWSMEHMDELRRFSVLGSSNQRQDRMTRLIRPGRFEAEIQIQAEEEAHDDDRDQPPALKLVFNDDGVAIGDFLTQLDEEARQMEYCPMAFYTSPVSYWNVNMAFHFGDYTSDFHSYEKWFKILTDFLAPRGRLEPKGRVNSFCGFFYTIEESWDDQTRPKSGRTTNRRPWAAIYRPVDLHIRPWRYMELLIWDVKAHDKAFASASLHVTDLIEAQQVLVRMVQAQCRSRVLPLSRVWLGGNSTGQSAGQYTHPLDMTLDWLRKLRGNIKYWAPLPLPKLREQGWKQVQASETPNESPSQNSMPADVEMKDADQIGDEGAVKQTTIFLPPPAPGKHPGAHGSGNRLYAWAEAKLKAGERGRCEYTFTPTMQWYREQLQEGRGFRHIQVSSWEPVFERYAIDDPKKV